MSSGSLTATVIVSTKQRSGRPFAEIFARYDHDFYRIDPMLFSPAVVELYNVETGNASRFGRMAAEVLAESFGGAR